jgi:hypothetical protein
VLSKDALAVLINGVKIEGNFLQVCDPCILLVKYVFPKFLSLPSFFPMLYHDGRKPFPPQWHFNNEKFELTQYDKHLAQYENSLQCINSVTGFSKILVWRRISAF